MLLVTERGKSQEVVRLVGQRLACFMQRRPATFLLIWSLAFGAAIWGDAGKLLWYDELLTYYGATATEFSRFWLGITHFDFNPPLQYVVVRASLTLFGDSAFSTRLPSILSFLAAMLILFRFVQRRCGEPFAFVAIGLLSSSGFLFYATEARPYAMELMFASAAFVSWSEAARQKHTSCPARPQKKEERNGLSGAGRVCGAGVPQKQWTRTHLGLGVSLCGLFASHCFAPVFLVPLMAGELAWSYQERRFDGRIWAAFFLPLPLAALYLPFLSKPAKFAFPPSYLATPETIWQFYAAVLFSILIPLGLGVGVAVVGPLPRKKIALLAFAPKHEWICLIAALLTPVLVIGYAIFAQLPFPVRYGIEVEVPVTLLGTFLLARLARGSTAAGALGALLILMNFLLSRRWPPPAPQSQI